MGRPENDAIKRRLASLDPGTERLVRINSGMGWTGSVIHRDRETITLRHPRPFHGAPEGTADLCGFTVVEITPDMVGQRVAVFTAEEVKATGRLSRRQRAFRAVVERMGGIFRVVS